MTVTGRGDNPKYIYIPAWIFSGFLVWHCQLESSWHLMGWFFMQGRSCGIFLGKVQLRELCFGCTSCCYLKSQYGPQYASVFCYSFFLRGNKMMVSLCQIFLSGSKFYPAVPGAIQRAIFCHSHVDLGLSPLDL